MSKQFRYTDERFWREMPEEKDWSYLEDFHPDYHRCDDIWFSDALSCVLEGNHEEKTLEWLYENCPEYEGYTLDQVQGLLDEWDADLYRHAEENFQEMIKNGEIEVRELEVTTVSARMLGEGDDDCVWLRCADVTTSKFRSEHQIQSCGLQNVKSRWIDDDTFQIYYQFPQSGEAYWFDAQSIDFE